MANSPVFAGKGEDHLRGWPTAAGRETDRTAVVFQLRHRIPYLRRRDAEDFYGAIRADLSSANLSSRQISVNLPSYGAPSRPNLALQIVENCSS